jgi:hypothetical protein
MPNQELCAAYDRFVMLMDRAADTIDRKALDQVGSLQEQVKSMTSEMETLFQSALADPSAPKAMAKLKQLILQALERLTLNQTRLTAWLNETGAGLGQLQQGTVAVRSYGASVRSELPLFEQQA